MIETVRWFSAEYRAQSTVRVQCTSKLAVLHMYKKRSRYQCTLQSHVGTKGTYLLWLTSKYCTSRN